MYITVCGESEDVLDTRVGLRYLDYVAVPVVFDHIGGRQLWKVGVIERGVHRLSVRFLYLVERYLVFASNDVLGQIRHRYWLGTVGQDGKHMSPTLTAEKVKDRIERLAGRATVAWFDLSGIRSHVC